MLRFAVALLAVPALIPFGAAAQAGLSVANYLLASETKISRTVSDFGYRAVVISTSGVARSFLTATVTSSAASVQVIQGNVNFLSVPANGSSTSIDTFTIRVDRSVAFNVANLHWTFAPTGPPTAPALTVGQNLQTTDRITLNSPAATDLTITVVSDDPSKLLFSLMAEAAGTSSIMIGVTAGRTATPDFFVHGLANSGSVTYSISAPGLGMGVGIVDFARSAFVIVGPFGIGQGFITTTGAANTDLTILAVVLDSSGKVIMPQAVRGGLVVNVPAISSNTTVGTITTSPVVFSGGVSFSSTQFDPATFGTTQISITTPSGFSTSASGASLNVTVSGPPPLRIADGLVIGNSLQALGALILGQAAPAGGLAVTLTSNSAQLKLSLSATTAGSASIVVNIPAGQTSAIYFIQAFSDVGSGTYSATALGVQPVTGTIGFAPSGVVISGPFGLGAPFPMTVSLASGPQTFTVSSAVLDPGSLAMLEVQPLAGGTTLSVSLANSNPAAGTAPSSVMIAGGSDGVVTLFTPLTVGQTTISVLKPAAFSQPSNNTALTVKVNP